MTSSARSWGVLSLAVVVLLVAIAAGARGSTRTAPCETVRYRRHIVAVLGTSEELVGAAVLAWRDLRSGHRYAGMRLLRSIVDYSPTYYDRESRLAVRTTECGL